MKQVMSLLSFVIAALCCVAFVVVFRPNAVSAVHGTSKPEYYNREASPTHICRPHVFAAGSSPDIEQRWSIAREACSG
jgi:hypothetical protein